MKPAHDADDLRNTSGSNPYAKLKAASAIASDNEEW